MRLLQAIVFATMLLLMATAATAGQVVLDFEDLSAIEGQPPPDPYGIVSWNDGWVVDRTGDTGLFHAHSGVMGLYYEGGAMPTWEFAHPVVYEGAYFSGPPYVGFQEPDYLNTVQYQLYNGETLVRTSEEYQVDYQSLWIPTQYGGLVDQVVVVSPFSDWWTMDDLTYNDPVPVPGAIWLLGSGLALVRFGRKSASKKCLPSANKKA
ncbi:MAG: hypothetical protein V2A77_01710 [Pseudomonadota bacterium]